MNKSRILAILLLLIGLIMTGIAVGSPDVVDAFKIYWMAVAAAIIPGIMLLMGKTNAAVYFARIVVGSIFIVSGLIKANDTIGFSIKLEEYFDENALGSFWAAFHDYALPLAIFISGIEVLLGLAVIFGAKSRLASFALLGMTLFFGWLTYFTAECNDAQMAAITAGESFNRVCVTDCGCFGDALRGSVGRSLTPWESFYKDLGLFFLTLIIVVFAGRIKLNTTKDSIAILPGALLIMLGFGGWLFGWFFPTYFFVAAVIVFFVIGLFKLSINKREWSLALALALITYSFALFTYRHLPIKDYRPYAVGKNIKTQMMLADELGLQATEYANIYKLENSESGEKMTMNSKEYLEKELWKDKSWKIASTGSEPVVITQGYESPIASFNVMTSDDMDIGEELLNDPKYSFMVVAYDISKSKVGKVPAQPQIPFGKSRSCWF